MDRKSIMIERKSITTFLSNISFNKQYYNLYNNIITRKLDIDENVLIFLICQTAFQVGFDGYFDEFYIDISKRRHVYITQILRNLRTAYVSLETVSSTFFKVFCCLKMSNREKSFNRIIQFVDLDTLMAQLFVEDDEELKQHFIAISNLILSQNQPAISRQIVPVD